jgi:hypothetical protein
VVDMELVFRSIALDVIGRHGFAQDWSICSGKDWRVVEALLGMMNATQRLRTLPLRQWMFWDKVRHFQEILQRVCPTMAT